MTENSFENKALSNLAETCNAENGTYRGEQSSHKTVFAKVP